MKILLIVLPVLLCISCVEDSSFNCVKVSKSVCTQNYGYCTALLDNGKTCNSGEGLVIEGDFVCGTSSYCRRCICPEK
jgi:hypothetical protein